MLKHNESVEWRPKWLYDSFSPFSIKSKEFFMAQDSTYLASRLWKQKKILDFLELMGLPDKFEWQNSIKFISTIRTWFSKRTGLACSTNFSEIVRTIWNKKIKGTKLSLFNTKFHDKNVQWWIQIIKPLITFFKNNLYTWNWFSMTQKYQCNAVIRYRMYRMNYEKIVWII